MFGNHGLCGLLEEGAHGKSPKCLGGNLGDFGGFCKGLGLCLCVELKNPACGCLSHITLHQISVFSASVSSLITLFTASGDRGLPHLLQ